MGETEGAWVWVGHSDVTVMGESGGEGGEETEDVGDFWVGR